LPGGGGVGAPERSGSAVPAPAPAVSFGWKRAFVSSDICGFAVSPSDEDELHAVIEAMNATATMTSKASLFAFIFY
jgi:hypothetical protein